MCTLRPQAPHGSEDLGCEQECQPKSYLQDAVASCCSALGFQLSKLCSSRKSWGRVLIWKPFALVFLGSWLWNVLFFQSCLMTGLCQLALVDPSLAFLRVEMTGRLKDCRPHIRLPSSVYLSVSVTSGLWGELSHPRVHGSPAFPTSCSVGEGDYCCRKKRNNLAAL